MENKKTEWFLTLDITVAWGEMDAFGHVNNTVYLRWFESARMAFFEKTAVLEKLDSDGIGPILARSTIDYRKPVKYPDRVSVSVRLGTLGNTSFTLVYRATNQVGDVVAEGDSVLVMLNYRTGTKVAIPEGLRKIVT